MDDLHLNSDETVLHKTQPLILSGVRHDAVLTGRRLILVLSETGKIHEDIPYAEITRAVSGMNTLREPVITLTSNSHGGEKRTTELIFIRQASDQSIAERDKCIAVLRDHNVPVEAHDQLAGPAFSGSGQRIQPGELVAGNEGSRPPVPDWTVFSTPRKGRLPETLETPQKPPIVLIAAVLIIIIVLVIGFMGAGQVLNAKNAPDNRSVTEPDTTIKVASSPSPLPEQTPRRQVTPDSASSLTALPAPQDGVWVNISYPGQYSGYIGALGRSTEINSSGTRFYKIPVDNGMVEGSIEKMDGSAEKIEVGIYNGGKLVFETGTAKPWAVVDIHVKVGPAIGNTVVIAPPSPEITISPYTSLPMAGIPQSGVFVRVFYPGNFTGSLRANGLVTNVISKGDQFYQIPVASGMVDAIIEKKEGTAGNLIIELYKNGKLVSHTYTSTPLGVAEIHEKV